MQDLLKELPQSTV